MGKLARAIGVVAFSIATPAANAGVLTGFLESEVGPQNDVTWTIGVTDTGATAATNVKIDSATLTQTAGAACTPVVTLPGALGTIGAGATAFGSVAIDFTGCGPFDDGQPGQPPGSDLLRFTLDAAFSADGLTGSLHLTDLTTEGDGTVYPAAATPVPEPPAWVLALLGFGLLGTAWTGRRRLTSLRSARA